jgi:hypothetical protein
MLPLQGKYPRLAHGGDAMSKLTRYAFSLLICLYGIYELTVGQLVAGVIGVLLAVLIFFVSPRR